MLHKIKYENKYGMINEKVVVKVEGGYHPVNIDRECLISPENFKILEEKEYRLPGTRQVLMSGSDFGKWMRENLPSSSTGLCIADFDWILWNYKTRRLMFLEEKAESIAKDSPLIAVNTWLKIFRKEVFLPAFTEFCYDNQIDFKGYNLLKIKDGFKDMYWSTDFETADPITEEQLKEKLSL